MVGYKILNTQSLTVFPFVGPCISFYDMNQNMKVEKVGISLGAQANINLSQRFRIVLRTGYDTVFNTIQGTLAIGFGEKK